MRVKAIHEFRDLKENVKRKIGDEFEVSDFRYNEILTKGGKWVEIVPDKDFKYMTKDEIMARLDEKGIKYSKKETKSELLKKLGD